MEGEVWEAKIGKYIVVVSPPYITFMRGSWRLDINMAHVHAIEVDRSLKWVIIGLLVAAAGVALAYYWPAEGVAGVLGLLTDIVMLVSLVMFMTGIATAIYGWLNRYMFTLYFGSGAISLRDGGSIVAVAERVRSSLEEFTLSRR